MVYYDVKIKYTQKKELKEQKLKEAFYAINGVLPFILTFPIITARSFVIF